MLPNLFVIGAEKCGTTSLHSYLAEHPEIYMSEVKEPRYFTRYWDSDRSWYEALFADAGDARWRGEATPTYSKATEHPDTAARIASLVPEARLVYLVRDPVARVRSQYEHRAAPAVGARKTKEARPFPIAIREDSRYVDGSRYAFQIEHVLDHFPRDQLHVMSSERLRDDRRAALREVFAFLAVDAEHWCDAYESELQRSDEKVVGSRSGERVLRGVHSTGAGRWVPAPARRWVKQRLRRPRPAPRAVMSAADEAWLWEQLEPDVRRLRTHVGDDFPLWHGI